ncbi:MAG TPA: hybrid sensor histidine kinase/response regulator, partial [Pyrinomonadaceae bacterium]|nr:hybrid sensor histidine kinase/response regulator [Pyrinomonadaceae bacterium]
YDSVLAFDGLEALELFRKNKADLIIADVMMPKIDGFELVTRIRKFDPFVPIIFLTAKDDRVDRDLGMSVGADAYITKPFSLRELFQEVGALLNKTPIERENDRLKFSNSWLSRETTRLETKIKELKATKQTDTADVNVEKDHAVYATMAHDMTNELGLIGGALQAIRHLAAGSDEIQEECDLMERSLHYSGQLLRRFKNYAQIIKPHLEPLDIPELIKRAESLLRPRIPSNIVFELDTDLIKLEGKVLVDADQVIGVLIEITNNAVHALRNTEGIIKLNASVQDGVLGIAISNNGPRILEDIRKQLFKERVRSSKEKGTGMGLFLAKQVLSTFGGTISSTEPIRNWVTFEIHLPLYKH